MSCGQHKTLEEVVAHYNRADDLSVAGHSDLEPLGLDERESAQLVALLRSLDNPVVNAAVRAHVQDQALDPVTDSGSQLHSVIGVPGS